MFDHNVFYPDWIPVDLALPIKNAFFDGKKFCSRFPVVSWCSVTIMPDCR